MTATLEERLSRVMQQAAPDLRPDPRLARRAVAQAARRRRWRWVVAPIGTAVASTAVWGMVVVALHGPVGDDDVSPQTGVDAALAVDPMTGELLHAPDWARCDRPPHPRNALVDRVPEVTDPVAIALCGPARPNTDLLVWVAAAAEARAVLEQLPPAAAGSLTGCAGEGCERHRLALLDRSGDVVELTLWLPEGSRPLITSASGSWDVDPELATRALALTASAVGHYTYPKPAGGGPIEGDGSPANLPCQTC